MRCLRFLIPLTIQLVLFIALPLAQGQANRLPPCSPGDIALAQSLEGEASRLVVRSAAIESMDDLLIFGAEQLAWRHEIWATMPLCDDGFAYGITLEQLTDALLMKLLLQSAGLATEDNPYVELGLESAKEVNRLEHGFPAVSAGAAATTASLRACSAEERVQLAGGFWTGIVNLVDELHAVDSFEKLLSYIDATLAWRAAIWSELTPCAEAYDIAIWKAQFSADIAKLFMLDLFRVERAANPFGDTYLLGIIEFSDFRQWIEMTGRDYTSLPSCAETPIDLELYQAFRRHHDWTEVPHSTVEALPQFAVAHIAWRETLVANLPSLPGCREAFETALLTLQVTGDAAAIAALSASGIGMPELGAAYQKRVVSAGERIDELSAALRVAPSAETAGPAVALPQCSNSDLDILFDDLQGFSQLQERAFALQRTDELILYIQGYFEWRDRLWTPLPGCAQAFQVAALMMQILGDYAAQIAMILAGAPEDAIPYPAQTDRNAVAFNQWHAGVWAPIEGPVATPGPSVTYYVDANGSAALRKCASSDCDIVALAADGEALNVVDDSGDWYEVYVGAGVIGYIPREFTTAAPPDG